MDTDSLCRSPVALVTGGAVRVGRAISLGLARAGFELCVHYYLSAEQALALKAEVEASGTRCYLLPADLTHQGVPGRVIAQAVVAMGRLDLLVNSAAVFASDDDDTIALARMKLLNYDAPRALLAAARPHLARTGGAVVNIADVAALVPFSRSSAYSYSKAALVDETREQARALLEEGIRVNAVCPGTVLPHPSLDAAAVARIRGAIPMGRLGSPEDVARAVVFFAASRFVTGQVLAVDGGIDVMSFKARQRAGPE